VRKYFINKIGEGIAWKKATHQGKMDNTRGNKGRIKEGNNGEITKGRKESEREP
jgi:hypothetical protein